jgi:hypothetical protein
MNRIVRLIWWVSKGQSVSLALVCACLALGASGCSTSSNSYWYCWDSPADGDPHHLGHPVSGDHICSDEELKNEGGPPR